LKRNELLFIDIVFSFIIVNAALGGIKKGTRIKIQSRLNPISYEKPYIRRQKAAKCCK